MDDWQETALSTRHMHNRVGQNGGQGGEKSSRNPPFDVRRSFGSYSCKCAAWKKSIYAVADERPENSASLQLYRMTSNGHGVVGKLSFPGVLEATVILAASRKSLRTIISGLHEAVGYSDIEGTEGDSAGSDNVKGDDSDGPASKAGFSDTRQDRFQIFEKNSFRSPKFWFQWSGTPLPSISTAGAEEHRSDTGLGYIVFSGNDCRKFSGTISCSTLNWKDVSITGHKIAWMSESDIPIVWAETGTVP